MIQGTKINLRAIEDDDAILFHRWINDPEVTRFLKAHAFPILSLAQEQAWVASVQTDASRKNYAITLKDGTLIGSCELRNFDWMARSCEVGIMIGDKTYWGQGYGGAALELLLQIAFNGLNLHKVWLTCVAYNERGLRAYRRLGFVEEGRLRDHRFVDGRYYDTIMMGILEDEWRMKHNV